jgi:SPP1 gp7 family putative phage head morphogenesis protein
MAGRIMEDYKSELSGRAAVKTYDRMRRSDPQTAMALRALKTPILRAKWEVKPSKDDPELGEEIAQFCEHVLLKNRAQSWRHVLANALLKLDYGFALGEKVWEMRDRPEQMKDLRLPSDKVVWLTLEPRLPKTVWTWDGLPGPLAGITQYIESTGAFPKIPLERLVVFTNEREGDNYEGISLLRACFKPWLILENLEKIDLIGLERSAAGIPTISATDSFQAPNNWDEVRDRCEKVLANLQAMEQNYVFLPVPGLKFDLNSPKYENDAIRAAIRDAKYDICARMLEQFLQLGREGASGSRATASEQRGPFDLSLLAIAEELEEVFSDEVLPDLVRYNYGDRPGYPTLDSSGVVETDMSTLATIVKDLVGAGALAPDEQMEDWLRATLHLPAAVRDKSGSRDLSRQSCSCEHHYAGKGSEGFWRAPTKAERWTAFAQIKYDLDQAKDGFISRVGAQVAPLASDVMEAALRLVTDADYDGLLSLKLSRVGKIESKIQAELLPLAAYGRRTVREEHQRARAGQTATDIIEERQDGIREYQSGDDLDFASEEGIRIWRRVKARRQAEAIALAIEAALIDVGLRLIRGRADKTAAREALVEAATTSADRAVTYAAGVLVAEAFGMGRAAETKRDTEAGSIRYATYSALLDTRVCDNCRARDGQIYYPDDPEFEVLAAGNQRECLGGDRCRCMLVYTYEDEAKPTVIDWLPGDDPSIVMP